MRRALIVLGAVAVALLSTSGSAAVAGATAPQTASAIGDSCLIGRWVERSYSAPGNWTWPEAGSPTGPPVIPATGLAGLVITYAADGTQTSDFSNAQPVVASYQGHQLKVVIRGMLKLRVYADGRVIVPTTVITNNLKGTFYVDGVLDPYPTLLTGSGGSVYRCSATKLHMESAALYAGYGPELDDLTRTGTAGPPQSVISSVGSTLPTPGDLLRDPVALLINALLTLALILLVTFPSQLFNRTFEENHDAIRSWWTTHVPWLKRLQKRAMQFRSRYRSEASYAAVIVIGGVLASLLDPHFGPNLRTLALFAGAALALTAGSVVASLAAGAYRLTRHKAGSWRLHALPSGLLVAALCVLISRLVSFQPGYLYGLIGGVTFTTALSLREEGHVVAVTSLVTLAVSIGAWLVWVPVSAASAAHPTAFGWAVFSNFLAALFVSGIVGLLMGLVPLRFLPGEKLAKWHKGVWGAVFGVAGLTLLEVMLRPQSAGAHLATVPFWTTAGLFIAFGTVSVLFWGYFKTRRPTVSRASRKNRVKQE